MSGASERVVGDAGAAGAVGAGSSLGGSLLEGLDARPGAVVVEPASECVEEIANLDRCGPEAPGVGDDAGPWIVDRRRLGRSGIGAYFYFRPVPQPDYALDGIGEVFNYTLLTEEFNRLPVEERLKLLGQLVSRLKSMSGGESAMMAAFAAGIAGSAREQLEKNASRLMIDSWDKFALDYNGVQDEDREAFLDKTLVDLMKMAEALGGRVRDVSDEKRLADVRRQVERDREWLNKPENKPGGREFGRMWVFLETTVGGHSSPIQRIRGTQLMRDMGRRLRNEDISTGKPKGGG